jgi:exosortase E/protease (VPEID-CTERM system)
LKSPLQRVVLASLLFAVEVGLFIGWFRAKVGASFVSIFAFGFLLFFLAGSYLQYRTVLVRFFTDLAATPVRWRFLAGHFGAVLSLSACSAALMYGRSGFGQAAIILFGWYLSVAAAIALGLLAICHLENLSRLIRDTSWLALSSSVVGAGIVWMQFWSGRQRIEATVWQAIAQTTFNLVSAILRPILPGVVGDSANMTLDADNFRIRIALSCTGIEGITMITGFAIIWLWFFRKELRFPLALLLVPASALLIYLLNALRIAALLLVGNAGYPKLAVGGFHTQVGWIYFVGVAVALCYLGQSSWLAVGAQRQVQLVSSPSYTEALLMPVLAILAAAMISRALSAGFEWLYLLRVLAALGALWVYRRQYRDIDWTFDCFGIATGVLVLLMWLGLDRLESVHADNGIGAGLAALSQPARVTWIAMRVLGASLTVPIAEELAFRGYLLRRLQSEDFETIPWKTFTYTALLVSSLAFGLMHGSRWIAGTIAGLLYAAAMLRRGRLGDAVIAHATTNALLSVWVLSRGAWWLW